MVDPDPQVLADLHDAVEARRPCFGGSVVAYGSIMMIEEPFPWPADSPERAAYDKRHAAMVAGLLRCADRSVWVS